MTGNELISETERKLGPPPRRLGFEEQLFSIACAYHSLRYRWASDKLYMVLESRKRLLREGEVALGMIVQANVELYSPGDYDLPANAIYSSRRTAPDLLDALSECSTRLFALKNTEPDEPEEKKFAEMITDEYRREMRVPVPKEIAGVGGVTLTTIFVFRKDLPHAYLSNAFFPMLFHRETPATIIVPFKYWPDDLLHAWEPE